MLLQHIHYTSKTPILYTHALRIQEIFARQHLNYKAHLSSRPVNFTASQPPKPNPKLLTFSSQPTYTTGLRDSRSLTTQQLAILTATGAAHHASPRGGLTTYHGPGQLTAFLITTLAYHTLTPRCYVHFLEDAVISTARVHGVEAGRWSAERGLTEARDESRPGVWTSRDGKLCSVGIHFRRGVSSFGLGFNVTDEVGVWFERIVACGIPDARAVSLMGERSRVGRDGVVGVDDVAVTLAQVIADGLDGVEGVEVVDCRELGEMDD